VSPVSDTFDVPDPIEAVLTDKECANLRSRDGWAVGVVKHINHGEVVESFRPAFIELFNGEGRAGEFGGVRFMAAVDSEEPFEEAYAYATREAAEEQPGKVYYAVTEYLDPDDPDYGQPGTK
jgi:hypothetical protein